MTFPAIEMGMLWRAREDADNNDWQGTKSQYCPGPTLALRSLSGESGCLKPHGKGSLSLIFTLATPVMQMLVVFPHVSVGRIWAAGVTQVSPLQKATCC